MVSMENENMPVGQNTTASNRVFKILHYCLPRCDRSSKYNIISYYQMHSFKLKIDHSPFLVQDPPGGLEGSP